MLLRLNEIFQLFFPSRPRVASASLSVVYLLPFLGLKLRWSSSILLGPLSILPLFLSSMSLVLFLSFVVLLSCILLIIIIFLLFFLPRSVRFIMLFSPLSSILTITKVLSFTLIIFLLSCLTSLIWVYDVSLSFSACCHYHQSSLHHRNNLFLSCLTSRNWVYHVILCSSSTKVLSLTIIIFLLFYLTHYWIYYVIISSSSSSCHYHQSLLSCFKIIIAAFPSVSSLCFLLILPCCCSYSHSKINSYDWQLQYHLPPTLSLPLFSTVYSKTLLNVRTPLFAKLRYLFLLLFHLLQR